MENIAVKADIIFDIGRKGNLLLDEAINRERFLYEVVKSCRKI